jgi:hypothetical protein
MLNSDDKKIFDITGEDIKTHKRKEFNKKQKTMMKVIGENLASYACVLILILLVGLIWTDIGLNLSPATFITDSLVSVVLFILADICMTQIGTKGGRLDEDYIKLREEYNKLRGDVRKKGLTLMDDFCESQIEIEYEHFIRSSLKELEIDYVEYKNSYSKKSFDELKSILPLETAVKLNYLKTSKRIELTPDMLMTEGKAKSERGGLPMSGEEYVEKHTTSWYHIATTVIFAVIAAVPIFALTNDVSWGRVIYTVFKLSMMFYRMYAGYSRGSKGYNTIEPKRIQAKIRYLYLYIEYVDSNYNAAQGDLDAKNKRSNTVDKIRAGGDRRECGDHGDPA